MGLRSVTGRGAVQAVRPPSGPCLSWTGSQRAEGVRAGAHELCSETTTKPSVRGGLSGPVLVHGRVT